MRFRGILLSKNNGKDRIVKLKEEIKIVNSDFANKTDSDKSAAINRLIFLLNDEVAAIRNMAANTLTSFCVAENVQLLSRSLAKDESVWVRRLVA